MRLCDFRHNTHTTIIICSSKPRYCDEINRLPGNLKAFYFSAMPTQEYRLLQSMINRSEKLFAELKAVYERDLAAHDVSAEALNITHEIIEKCSNVLDQTMTVAFEHHVKPIIAEQPKRGGYFPAAKDEQSYRSTLGQWNAANLDVLLPELDHKLRSLQPFENETNVIFSRIRELASKKHTQLAPQKRTEHKRVNVTRPGQGGVSWGAGVTFGSGISVLGVPIDPRTQMPAHSNGINVAVERWISFHFQEGGEDALAFCKSAIEAASRAVQTLLG